MNTNINMKEKFSLHMHYKVMFDAPSAPLPFVWYIHSAISSRSYTWLWFVFFCFHMFCCCDSYFNFRKIVFEELWLVTCFRASVRAGDTLIIRGTSEDRKMASYFRCQRTSTYNLVRGNMWPNHCLTARKQQHSGAVNSRATPNKGRSLVDKLKPP